MTAQNRATLKGLFEDGDVPTGANYTDLIDSFLSLSDTTAQSLSSPLTVTTVSGATGEFDALTVRTTLTIESTTTVAATSTGVSLPASAAGFIVATVSGATVAIPYYKVA